MGLALALGLGLPFGGAVSLTAAQLLLLNETQGLAIDFTDMSMVIKDTGTPANAYNSQGITASGALVGPGGKLTYSAPSAKITRQADGNYRFQAHNLAAYSDNLLAGWSTIGGSTTLTADTVKESAANSAHRFVFSASGNSIPSNASIELKADGTSLVGLYFGSGNGHVAVDLANGTIGSIASGFGSYISSATITALADGWYRINAPLAIIGGIDAYLLQSWTPGGAAVSVYAGNVLNGVKARKVHIRYANSNTDFITTTGTALYALPYEWNSSGTALGVRIEEARTNVVLQNRDLSNAAWTKTNVTAAKDQTGIDGAANSASSITATAGNGTCLQAITLGSSARYQSAFIKRITGSGTVEMTMDNGTTWTAVTVTSSWAPVEIPTQTLANPTVGFRIVTSGDAVAVDMVQNENGAFRTSPIVTAGATVTRAADNTTIAASLFPYNQPEGAVYVSFRTDAFVNTARVINLSGGGATARVVDISLATGNTSSLFNGTSSSATKAFSLGATTKAAAAYKTADYAFTANGAAVATLATVAVNTATTLQIGQLGSGANALNGWMQQVMYLPRRMTNTELVTVTT